MYLSKLEIHGFKSFANRITLRFTDGLTAIVGPNGSGKTNIVDALRWVIGEQKSSVLRSDGMEQVIFNGTRNRKPLGLAEVSLTIENNKQILSTDYDQVVISRRLYRDGESQYLINKTPCRLRDITDLFMDTGMGAGAYSVIELKMIEQILSERSDDRRHLFEEAAGVVKYKLRRKEALRRLAATQQDVERVRDILREVQKTVGSLARQAEKAKQYTEIKDKLQKVEQELVHREYAETKNELLSLDIDSLNAKTDKTTAETELQKHELELTAQSVRLANLDEELALLLEQERQSSVVATTSQQDLAVCTERQTSLQHVLERTRVELVDTKRQINSLKDEFLSSQTSLEQRLELQEQFEMQLRNARIKREEQYARVVEQRDISRIASEPILAADTRLQFLLAGRDRIRRSVETLHHQSSAISQQISTAERSVEEFTSRIEKEKLLIAERTLTVEKEVEVLTNARERYTVLGESIDGLQQEISEYRTTLTHSKASLEFLQGLQDSDQTTSYLLNKSSWSPVEKSLLAELVTPLDDTLSIAIETALGEAANYIVVATTNDIESARNELLTSGSGKATLIARNAVPVVPVPVNAPEGQGYFGWVSESVIGDESVKNILRNIVGSVLIVDTIENGNHALATYQLDYVVTLQGEVIHSNGAQRIGSVSTSEGYRVGKQKRIDTLIETIGKVSDTLSSAESILNNYRTERSKINLNVLTDSLRRSEQVLSSSMQQFDQFILRRESVVNTIEQLKSRMEQLTTDNTLAVSEDEGILREIDEVKLKKVEQMQLLEGALATLRNEEEILSAKDTDLRSAELHAVKVTAEIASLENTMKRILEQQEALEQKIEQSETTHTITKESLAVLTNEIHDKNLQYQEFETIFKNNRTQRISTEARVVSAKTDVSTLSEIVQKTRSVLEKAIEHVHILEIKESQLRTKSEEFKRRAKEELDTDLDSPFELTQENYDIDELRRTVQLSKAKLVAIGNVNFMAMEEHTKESERLQTLQSQYNDLVDAEKNLQTTIQEINSTAKLRFNEVFENVRVHFRELFLLLFNGEGDSDLRMEGEDPLEARIEIIAKPKGKRPHSIEMLSGGEKTLTAIALLFAIYLVKPSPFCILDEVDAPLDDANIDRYLQLIRKFSADTQFLMITHNKKTMEAADTLYGVTMEEVGVSKLVSVKLTESEETFTNEILEAEGA